MKKDIKKLVIMIIVVILITAGVIIGLVSCKKNNKSKFNENYQKVQDTLNIGRTYKLRSNEEIAFEVLEGHWGYGKEVEEKLFKAGYNPKDIKDAIDKLELNMKVAEKKEATPESEPEPVVEEIYYEEPVEYYDYPTGQALNPWIGVVYFNGHKETYYSQKVLPGGGLDIPGRHVAEDGTIRDENNYICVATDWSFIPYGELVETSLGTGKVYDTGCAYGTVDIYVNW